jgi:ribosomal protein S16
LGFFDPITKEFKLNNLEMVKKYISNGAQLSERIQKLMKINNITL